MNRAGEEVGLEGPSGGRPSPVGLSPDQGTAAVVRVRAGLNFGDVWLRDMDRGLEDPFTSDGTIAGASNVVWSPDGVGLRIRRRLLNLWSFM